MQPFSSGHFLSESHINLREIADNRNEESTTCAGTALGFDVLPSAASELVARHVRLKNQAGGGIRLQ